jgi:hypothetical protein
MSAQYRINCAVPARRHAIDTIQQTLRGVFLLGAMTVLVGCTVAPSPPFIGPDPSDPSIRVPAAGYRSTIAPFRSQRPVEPASWREQNERLAPQPHSDR